MNIMYDFLSEYNDMKLQYKLTFCFYKKNIFFKILKCLSICLFIIPTTLMVLVSLLFSLLNVLIHYIPILNIIFMFFIYYFLDIIVTLLFDLCNIFEIKEYLK